jgi:hypothetical protein
MSRSNRFFSLMILAGALATPLITTACAHHYHRVYDPFYSDYHVWTPDEDVYYRQWITERHYQYRDYAHLNKDEQKDYWNWRHSHGDHH